MGACLAKKEPEEARRARAVGMTLGDSMSLTGEELDELARREAMTPMKINCQTAQGEVMPSSHSTACIPFLFRREYFYLSSPTTAIILSSSPTTAIFLSSLPPPPLTDRDHGAWLGASRRFDQA